MTQESSSLARLRAQMRQAFFDLSTDDVLVYKDPSIGELQNGSRGIVVRLNRTSGQLEVVVGGSISEAFDPASGVEHACRDAFVAYFRAFASLCGQQKREAVAA